MAETVVFALSPHVGRVDASRIVTEALASDGGLQEVFDHFSEMDLKLNRSDSSFVTSAAETAARVFANRRPPGGSD